MVARFLKPTYALALLKKLEHPALMGRVEVRQLPFEL
jgi:hypothetical protein